MMRKGKRKSAAACLAAGFILACYLAQTVDCFGLRKVERRGRTEAERTGFQEGKIVFGRGSSLTSQVIDGTGKVSNASAEDEAAYQADSTGWSKGQAQDAGSKEASWKRMAPTLQCAGDQMKFRAVGPGASQFTVEQGNASPVPLSQIPPTCGYSMQRNSLALVMLVPFDGCNVVQEAGNYMLPMRWQGVPISLLCPKPVASTATPAEPHHPVPQTPSYPQMHPIKHPGAIPPNPYFFPPYMPYPVYSPTTTTTTKKPEQKPDMPKIPQYPFYPPLHPYFPHPLPVATAAPTTTTAATTKAPPPAFPFPYYPPVFPPVPWPFPGPLPTTAAPTTTTTASTKPQSPQFPPFFPPFPFPPYPVFPPPIPPYYPTPKPQTTPTTTTSTTTTTTAKPGPTQAQPHHPHIHPHVHLPFPFPFLPPHYPFPG